MRSVAFLASFALLSFAFVAATPAASAIPCYVGSGCLVDGGDLPVGPICLGVTPCCVYPEPCAPPPADP